MYAGLLRHPIEIYTYRTEKNEYGEPIVVSSLKYSTRAKVSHAGGSRGNYNHEITYPYSKIFTVRNHVPVDENDRILYEGKYYIIQSIDNDIDNIHQKTLITILVNE